MVAALALTVPFAVANAAAAAPASVARTSLAGSSPAWIRHATVTGRPSAGARLNFQVVLPLRDAAGAARVAAAVSNPKSAQYGHYLSAAQFNRSYAPTTAQVDTVRDYLSAQGFTVSGLAQGNRWISASATVRQVERSFAITLHNYRYGARTLRAASGNLSITASMSGRISAILGVSQNPAKTQSVNPVADVGRPADAQPPRANCSTYWDQYEQTVPVAYGRTSFPTNNCGYSPAQLRGAYGVQSAISHGVTGAGVRVAIIDAYASSTILSDANALFAMQGEPAFAPGQYTETDLGPFVNQDECGGEGGWNEEESLDVEAVHGMAPGASVHYVGASDCDTGIDTAINYVIQNQVADLVSNSYGDLGEDGLGAEVATENSLFLQAAVEGIGYYYSTGDDGDNVIDGTPHPEPDFPATDPYVTAVGGTSLGVTAQNGYQFETSWGDDLASVNFATSPSSYATSPPGDFLFGGGGGVSALFAQPAYQKLLVPRSLAKLNGSTAMRVVPDVATVGDPETGFLIVFNGTSVIIGGTSLACPVFAGIQALASQGRRRPIGFANPLLYGLGLTGLTYHDVSAPRTPVAMASQSGRSLLTFGQDSSLTSTKGYDDTTGLGTPYGPLFLLGERLL